MIYSISISVYDTTLPASPAIPINYAARTSCKLYYDGGDSKLITLMASRLEFAMEVDYSQSLNSLFYDHLFTGNETKFKTIVRDQDDNILWEGFLLPDEYSEPFTTGTFFVNLTATDGLGRLEGKHFSEAWYRARHSYTKILADCLKMTGLELDINLAPAIENVGFQAQRWDNIFIDGASWGDTSSKATCKEILEDILKETACTLFQQDGEWYVIGYNHRNASVITYYHFDKDGVYEYDNIQYFAPPKYNDWNAGADISIKPPYKEVVVNTGVENIEAFFPEDMIQQEWEKTAQPQEAPQANYWDGTGTVSPTLTPLSGSDFAKWDGSPIDLTGAVGFFQNNSVSVGDVFNHYMSFATPFFIKGNRRAKFKLAINYVVNDPAASFDFETYLNQNVWYDVLLNGTQLISNRTGFSGREAFLWKFTRNEWVDDYYYFTMTVEMVGVEIPENGFLDFRLYHGSTSVSTPRAFFAISEFQFDFENDVQTNFVKTRDINFTKTETLDIKHGDSVFDLVKNNFIFQPLIPENEFTEVPFAQTYAYDGDNNPLGWALFLANESDYLRVITQPTKIYLQRIDSDFPEYVEGVRWINTGQYYVFLDLPDGHIVRTGDRLLVREGGAAGNPQTTAVHNYREQWNKTTNNRVSQRFGFTLAEIIHDVNPSALVFFEGTQSGLVFPLSNFGYVVGNYFRKWVPLRLEIVFGENETNTTFIEYKNENVIDYEA